MMAEEHSETTQPSSKRFKFSIASLLALTAICAVVFKWPTIAMYLAIVAIPMLLLAFAENINTGKAFSIRYLWTIAAIYVPALMGFFDSGTHCRKVWPEMFPIAPGLIPSMFVISGLGLKRHRDSIGFSFAALMILAVIALMVFLIGRRNRFVFAGALVALTGVSIFFVRFLIMILHA